MDEGRPPPGWGQGFYRGDSKAPVRWGAPAPAAPESAPDRTEPTTPLVAHPSHPANQYEVQQHLQADLERLRAEVKAWREVVQLGARWHLGRALAQMPAAWPAQATPAEWQEFLERSRWSDPPQPPIAMAPAPAPPVVVPAPDSPAAEGPDIVAAAVVSPLAGSAPPPANGAGRRQYLRQQYQWEAPPTLSPMGLKAATLYFERLPAELARFVKQIKQETQHEAGLSPADATRGAAELVEVGLLAEAEWEDRTMLLPGPQWPDPLAHPWTEISRQWPDPLQNLAQSVHSRQTHGLRLNHNQLCYLALDTPGEALGGDLTLGEGDISLISAQTGVAWLVVDSLRWESAQHRAGLLAAMQTQAQARQGLHLITFGVSDRTELSQLLHTQVLSGLGYAVDSDDLAPIGTQINPGPDL